MGLHGIPMGNMSNQQLMQMQLHGMDLQRMGMELPGIKLCDVWLETLLSVPNAAWSVKHGVQSCYEPWLSTLAIDPGHAFDAMCQNVTMRVLIFFGNATV